MLFFRPSPVISPDSLPCRPPDPCGRDRNFPKTEAPDGASLTAETCRKAGAPECGGHEKRHVCASSGKIVVPLSPKDATADDGPDGDGTAADSNNYTDRTAARVKVPARKMKSKILFVCHGNICRSPMAECMMRKMVSDAGRQAEYEIESAATSTEELGNDIYPPAKSCLRAHGVPFVRREARQMTRADYDYFDHIFLMDNNNYAWLARRMPDLVWRTPSGWQDRDGKVSLLMELAGVARDVADPWYTGNFERTFLDISRALSCYLMH